MRKFLFSLLAVLFAAVNVNAQKEVTFDFDNNATELFGTDARSWDKDSKHETASHAGDITSPITATVNGVTITVSENTNPNAAANQINRLYDGAGVLRLYGGTLKISAPGEKIVGLKYTTNRKWDSGNKMTPEGPEAPTNAAWTAPKGGVDEVTINVAGNTQFKTLTVVLYDANAVKLVQDYFIDYTTTDWNFYVMGYTPEKTENGILSKNPMEGDPDADGNPTPNWYQYFVADQYSIEPGNEYTVTAMVKASEEVTFNLNMGWGWGEGESLQNQITVPTEWTEVTLKYAPEITEPKKANLVAQPGVSTATIEWAWIKITHLETEKPVVDDPYEAPEIPEGWVNLIVNGDASGEYGEVPCVVAKSNVTGETVQGPATIEELDGEKVFAIHAGAKVEQPWDNQLWIMAPKSFAAGEKFLISFRYKAAEKATVGTQSHKGPGGYKHYVGIGDVAFTKGWKTFTKEITVDSSMDGMDAVAFNLNDCPEANDYYLDNVIVAAPEVTYVPDYKNVLVNGDAEGKYAAAPAVMQKINIGDEVGAIVPAKVAEVDGNKVFAVTAGAKVAEAWDNQLWIQSPVEFKAGDLVKVSFKYKASKAAKASTQQHGEAGTYIHWAAIGDVNFTADWQTFEGQFAAEKDGVKTIAFNLSELAEPNVYLLDDVQLIVDVNKVEVPVQEGVTDPEVIDIPSENMLLALVDKAEVEALIAELTQLSNGNEEYFTPDDWNAWLSVTNTYEMMIENARKAAEEEGTTYESPMTPYKETLKEIIATVKGKIDGTIPLYTADGYVYESQIVPEVESVKVEAFAKHVIIRGLAGTEGYDLKVEFDEEENVTSITPIVNGEEGTPVTSGYAKVYLNENTYIQPYIGPRYSYASSDKEYEAGYVSLYAFDKSGELFDVYYLVWGEYPDEVYTLADLKAIELGEEDPGMECLVNLDNAKITLFNPEQGLGFMQDDEVGVIVAAYDEIEGFETGKAITGLVYGGWMNYGYGPMLLIVDATDAEFTDAVATPTEIATLDDLADQDCRLVKVTNSEATPISVFDGTIYVGGEENMLLVGDLYDEPFEVPETVKSVTGIYALGGMLFIRTAEDIEADGTTVGIQNAIANNQQNGAIFNLAGQKVNAQFKGIVMKNGKKMLVK